MTKIEKQLEQARIDLDAANKDLRALDAAKAEALKSSKAYAEWRAAVDTKTLERERLESVVSTTEAEVERAAQVDAANALRKRRAGLEKASAELAQRITREGAAAAAVLVELAELAKENSDMVEALNRELPDSDRLMTGDFRARHRDPAPRQNLEETTVDLWVFESSGDLVGDQDAVRELSYERGVIPGAQRNIPVLRKRFRQIRYLEPGDREHAEPLSSVLRLPRFDAPGLLFDRGRVVETSPRRELLELMPESIAKTAANEAA
ncbi:hypothetical protein [Bradyrhizobium liaoningense]|uniref:hypothetical protein n=1 Tax=Bradyrhizobium liaoningense TaxID=43992 RepID=UPI001BAA8DB7|nr:hypothetical protein [Bradyrhizobium liaoningense]MBR0907022.1 hypothetical protein [Bradyrhizobium liaoningense]